MSKRKLREGERITSLRNEELRLAVKSSPANSWRELDSVGASLLGTNTTISIEEALRIAQIWRLRQIELPHAIDSTASIAEILHNESNYSEHELRLLLSAVITRSVNGVADSLQQNRAVATSVAFLCSTIGIPTWIVQLRHNATHQQLPPLATLRMGVTSMLTFFDSTFWTPLRQQHQEAYDGIMEKLMKYEAEVQKVRKREAEQTPKAAKEEKEQEGNEEEDVDDDDDDDPFGFSNSRLGSTKNQFALLQTTKRKKSEHKPKPKRKKGTIFKLFTTMATDIVGDQSCPPDILFDALLDFFLSKDTLIPFAPHRYQPLLHAVGMKWAGFLPRFLVQCSGVPDEGKAVSLVGFLCSKSFVEVFSDDDDDSRSSCIDKSHAPAAILCSKLKYPLNSLCDKAKPDSVMHCLLLEILEEDRVPFYGLQEEPNPTETNKDTRTDPKAVWKRCVHWEPWSFGSLPTEI